jgi:peptidyl-prolyl cis-trans isomerase SurA
VSLESKEFAREQLESVRKRILRGESFEKLARAYSMDPGSKAQGGLLPEFGRGEMASEFERMAFKLKPDSLSPIFETEFGYHIMRVSKRRGERVVASHILIRAENTNDDITRALYKIDSAYNLLVDNKIQWCDAVKKYATAGDKFVAYDKGTCGYFTDVRSGMQTLQFESLPPDVRKIAEKMKPGEVSEPALISTEDGRPAYRMIYVNSVTPPHTANLIQDYSKIQMQADSKKKYETLQKWIKVHRNNNYIRFKGRTFDCENLKSWEHE